MQRRRSATKKRIGVSSTNAPNETSQSTCKVSRPCFVIVRRTPASDTVTMPHALRFSVASAGAHLHYANMQT